MSATASSGSPSRPISSVDSHSSWTSTPAGDEQLAHRLAPLDLLATETLAAALRRVRRAAVATAHRTGAPGAPAPRRRRSGHRRARRRRAASGLTSRRARAAFAPLTVRPARRWRRRSRRCPPTGRVRRGPPPPPLHGHRRAGGVRSGEPPCRRAAGASLRLLADDRAIDVADGPPGGDDVGRDPRAATRSSRPRRGPDRCRGSAGRCRRGRPHRAAPRRRRGRRRRRRCGRPARAGRGTRSRRAPAAGQDRRRSDGCRSPDRLAAAAVTRSRRSLGEPPAGPLQVVGLGDLAVPRLARHDDHPAPEALDQRGVVGARRRPRRGRVAGRRRGTPAASARRRACSGRACDDQARASTDLDRVGHRRPPAPHRRRRRELHRRPPRTASGVASGRAASWTQMIVASSGTAASPARTDALRVGPAGDGVLACRIRRRHDDDDAVARASAPRDGDVEDARTSRAARTAWRRRTGPRRRRRRRPSTRSQRCCERRRSQRQGSTLPRSWPTITPPSGTCSQPPISSPTPTTGRSKHLPPPDPCASSSVATSCSRG